MNADGSPKKVTKKNTLEFKSKVTKRPFMKIMEKVTIKI